VPTHAVAFFPVLRMDGSPVPGGGVATLVYSRPLPSPPLCARSQHGPHNLIRSLLLTQFLTLTMTNMHLLPGLAEPTRCGIDIAVASALGTAPPDRKALCGDPNDKLPPPT
jgi:hypothetical protein